ncbi:MAG TPA: PH domain-containing protein [Methylomirabilota bacterium]|nr:PH domain-containing protein [Methylomirabilota bacterium]
MSPLIVALTAVILVLPAFLVVAGLWSPARFALLGAAAFVVALCVGVWLFARPSRFDVSGEGLILVWPLRRRVVPRGAIASVRVMRREELRAEVGWAVRVGVGGLWGAFGSLWSSRRGSVEVYVSRTDRLVWIERRAGRPLLITPEDPERFVRTLTASLGAQPPGTAPVVPPAR